MPKAHLMCIQAIAQAEAQKAAMEMRAAAVREEQEDLQKELETLQLTVEAAKADVGNAQRDLRSLRDKVSWVLGLQLPAATAASSDPPKRCSKAPTEPSVRLPAAPR